MKQAQKNILHIDLAIILMTSVSYASWIVRDDEHDLCQIH